MKTNEALFGPKWWQNTILNIGSAGAYFSAIAWLLKIVTFAVLAPRRKRHLRELKKSDPACLRDASITFYDEVRRRGWYILKDGTECWGSCWRSSEAEPWQPIDRPDDGALSAIRQLFNLSHAALNRACLALGLKANDVKEGVA